LADANVAFREARGDFQLPGRTGVPALKWMLASREADLPDAPE
jgi:hypothetical protein